MRGWLSAFTPSTAQKELTRQDVSVGPSGVAGVSAAGNVTITVNPNKPEPHVFKQPHPMSDEIDYRDLASPALSEQLVGKTVLFRAMYLSEWNQHEIYRFAGISVSNVFFINHRSVYYGSSMSALGSSDSEIPPFPITISSSQLDTIRKLNRGDFILLQGTVEQPKPELRLYAGFTPDYSRIVVHITDVKILQSD